MLTNLVPPYRLDAYNALHGLAHKAGGGLTVICTNRTEPQRNWPKTSGDFNPQPLDGLVLPLGENRTFSIPIGTKNALHSATPDALILNGFGIAQLQASRWAQTRNIPTILQFDGWIGSDQSYANPVRKHIRRQMIAKADGFVAASSRGKEWFQQFGVTETDISVAPIPISFPPPQTVPGFAERPYELTWCGRTTKAKGFDVFLKVAAELKKRKTIKRIANIGCTDLEQAQSDLSASGLSDITGLHPQLTPTELPTHLCKSKLCLFPSNNDAYGVGVIDAIACGAVALASPLVGCAPDMLDRSEILDAGCSEDWVTASQALLSNQPLWQQTQQSQANKIKDNTPNHQAKILWKALLQATSKTTGERRWS